MDLEATGLLLLGEGVEMRDDFAQLNQVQESEGELVGSEGDPNIRNLYKQHQEVAYIYVGDVDFIYNVVCYAGVLGWEASFCCLPLAFL